MLNLTPEQKDQFDEVVDRQLFRLNKVVRAFFGTEMSNDELRRAKSNSAQGAIHEYEMEKAMKPAQPGITGRDLQGGV